ncbi:acetate--CoA ligase family protein [Paenibacillus sp. LjRoot153]|uniref:acetate--CoA ligase family protein n=1 Tax=Paenibacillus sp. LjRoot153 TaxID=3342270 RepID=UPI003ECF6849
MQAVKKFPIRLFYNPKQLASTLTRLAEFYERSRGAELSGEVAANRTTTDGAAQLQEFAKQTSSLTLTEIEGKQVLQSVGISVPENYFLPDDGDIESFLTSMPFDGKRYVAKLVSRTITHKSDSGGVALNLKQPEQVREFFERRIQQSTDTDDDVDGMLLEEMVGDKVELILGSTNDPIFGPVVLIGLGGVLTELFQLVTWRVAPFDKEEAKRMLGEIKGLLTYLQGFRNMPETDMDALLQTLETFSYWVYDQHDTIESVEINPLAVLPKGEGVNALDCVITLKSDADQAVYIEI